MDAEKVGNIEKQINQEIVKWERLFTNTNSDTAYYYIMAYENALEIVRKEMI